MPVSSDLNYIDSAAVAQRVVKRRSQGIGYEAQRIQEIALASAVRPHQECQRPKLDIAASDALVILKHYPSQKSCVSHRIVSFSGPHRPDRSWMPFIAPKPAARVIGRDTYFTTQRAHHRYNGNVAPYSLSKPWLLNLRARARAATGRFPGAAR